MILINIPQFITDNVTSKWNDLSSITKTNLILVILFSIVAIILIKKIIGFIITITVIGLVLYLIISYTSVNTTWITLFPNWLTYSFFDQIVILIFIGITIYASLIFFKKWKKDRHKRHHIILEKSLKKECYKKGGVWNKDASNKCQLNIN